MTWHSRRVWALLLGSLSCVFSSTGLKTDFTTAQLSLLTRVVLFGFVFRRSRHSSPIYFSTYQQPGYSCAVSGWRSALRAGLTFLSGSRACFRPGHLRSSMVRKYWPAGHKCSRQIVAEAAAAQALCQACCSAPAGAVPQGPSQFVCTLLILIKVQE